MQFYAVGCSLVSGVNLLLFSLVQFSFRLQISLVAFNSVQSGLFNKISQ